MLWLGVWGMVLCAIASLSYRFYVDAFQENVVAGRLRGSAWDYF